MNTFMSFAPRAIRAPMKAIKPKLVGDKELAAIHLTNPEREIGKDTGVTKLDDDEDAAPRVVWYCDRTLRHWMDVQMLRNRNVLIALDDYAGKPCMGFRGHPVKIVDQILNTESRVV